MTTTEQPRDVAAEAMQAWAGPAGGTTATPTQTPQPGAASQPVFAPWGAVADPHEAIRVFEADPQTREALLDNGSPLHSSALKRRGELYAAAYGAERGDAIAGNGAGNMSPAIHEGYVEPTEAEMRAQVTNTATGILEKQGVDTETAQDIAGLAINSGLNSLDVHEVAQAIASSRREYRTVGEVMLELGADADRLIAAAQAESDRLKLPPELLSIEIGNIALGDHPALIRQLARRAGVR